MQFKTIEIDFAIHRAIEAERRNFDEAPYIALRRLLKLGEPEKGKDLQPKLEGRAFIEDGVEIPHGSEARMEYQYGRQIYIGKFLDGSLVVNGAAYPSLSAAASAVAITKEGTKPSLNGWLYWKAKFPGDSEWKSLDDLRALARRARK